MITLLEAYIAFAFGFGFILGADGFLKRHLVAEFLQFTGGFGFLLIPLWHLGEGLHILDVWWLYLLKPFYYLGLVGGVLGYLYKFFQIK